MPNFEILPLTNINRCFTYSAEAALAPGQLVRVLLAGRPTLGLCLRQSAVTANKLPFVVHAISTAFPFCLPPSSLTLLYKCAEYNLSPLGSVAHMFAPLPLSVMEKEHRTKPNNTYPIRPAPILRLSPPQQEAVQNLAQRRQFSVDLLDGVTGSGKTEVYLSALMQRFQEDLPAAQVLILLPEIALTTAVVQRFEKHFGWRPDVWHSGTTPVQKWHIWCRAITGEKMVVVGARSALFIPFANLSTIVVDEEHDPSYKQNEQGTYNARDMAVLRAQIEDIPLILASATPSLATMHNVQTGRYHRINLPTRFAGATLPQIALVDMRGEEGRPILSAPLSEAITAAIARGEQSLLFINQRGYAPVSLCKACGYIWECPQCDAHLIEHQTTNVLRCHHCEFAQPLPISCPQCNASKTRILLGIGMERALEAVQMQFPSARSLALSSDSVRSNIAWEAALQKVHQGEIDILLGTQILAKGHHFPNLTVAGVLEADRNFSSCDLRANERTYQLLHQVAGRTGRAQKPGRVFIQTYNPEHPLMQALLHHDRERFYAYELADREKHGMPPFKRLIAIIISGKNALTVRTEAERLARTFPASAPATLLGPVPAPLARLRGVYRYRLLLKIDRNVRLQPLVAQWAISSSHAVRIQIDVDPYEFM